MNKLLKGVLMSALLLPALAAKAEEPAITMRTGIYDTDGPNNACTLVVGGKAGTYIMVDCGFGPVEYEIAEATFDSASQSVKGTPISCQVSKEGLIKIYPDPDAELDYLDAEGCTLEWIEFKDPSKLRIVNFCHNNLRSLDLSDFTSLEIAYLSDNPYDLAPLKIGKNHPELAMLELNAVYNLDPEFDIDTYPKLTILDAFAVPGITKLTPSGCPGLVRLSVDCTNISQLDLSKNAALMILNISDTAVRDIDLSGCPNLQQLYVVHQSDTYNPGVKLKTLDVSMLPKLFYLFATGNDLTSIDVSKNPELNHLWLGHNKLTELDITNNPGIQSLHIEGNYFTYATLPEDRDTFIEYNYSQRPFSVPSELEVGKPLDLKAQVTRPDTQTFARLLSVKRESPYNPVEVDESKYTYSDGVLVVNKAISDSVYVEFVNSKFTESSLTTAKFMVKRAADMGKPDKQMTFQPGTPSGEALAMCIGIEGATPATPKTLYVTQGDGVTHTFSITTAAMPDAPNVTVTAAGYGQTVLSTDTSERISAVGIDGVTMYACDVTPMSSLRSLRLTGTDLYALDLRYNRCLEKLIVTGNHFGKFSLDGVSGDYMKNMLTHIDISNNEITELTLSFLNGIEYFDMHSNKLTEMHFDSAERISYLDVSDNQMELLKINYLSSLRELNASNNKLSQYIAPETNIIEKADFSNNCFTFANLPSRNGLAEADFKYAPQAKIVISKKAPGVDLSSQAVEIDGAPVKFAWYKADGTPLTEGVDYTVTDGRARFLNPSVGAVYCAMTCASLPAFAGNDALMTTQVIASEMPRNLVAEFTTADAGTMHLSLGAHNYGSTMYIDWNGDGTDLVEYFLTDTYSLFDAQVKAKANVKVYTYDNDNDIRVFSIGGVRLSSFNGAGLEKVTAFTVSDAGLTEITFPNSDNIKEIGLEGNSFTEFDATRFPKLTSLSLNGNKISTLDLTKCPDLVVLGAARNKLTEVKFNPGNKVFFLDLTGNLLESYDLQLHPDLNQVGLAGNRLRTINPDGLQHLRTFAIDENFFTFETLPLPQSQWTRYTYANQATVPANINGLVIDLSSQKEVNGTPTVYRWFIGIPTYNYDTEDWEGEELVANDEYTVDNGVTTLSSGYDKMICLMSNSELPKVVLTTDLLDLSAVETIEVDEVDADAVYYTLDGRRVVNPDKGLYIVVRGNKVTKEIIR